MCRETGLALPGSSGEKALHIERRKPSNYPATAFKR